MVSVAALQAGAIVHVHDVPPMTGTNGETKSRWVILLHKCLSETDDVQCVVIKTIRGSLGEHEIKIPHRPDGLGETGLTQPSAAACQWIERVRLDRVNKKSGKCPPAVFAQIVAAVQRLEDQTKPG